MTAIRLILGDQLDPAITALQGYDQSCDVVLMVEAMGETTFVPHHPKKIVLFLAAMRHFETELMAKGLRVDYVHLDDPDNSGSFADEIRRAVTRHGATRLIVTEAGEWRVEQEIRATAETLGLTLEYREDDRFFCSRKAFAAWIDGRKQPRMEFFYREMRKRTGILMNGADPRGGAWNFDKENRKTLPTGFEIPEFKGLEPDAITLDVIDLVAARFADHFGDIDGFNLPVTRDQALALLDRFVEECLPSFGDFQDAMAVGEPFLFHSLLAPALNIGLLRPREVVGRAVEAYETGHAPLNAVEGFVRQILGWREFVRGIYWRCMPDYAALNALEADRPLPEFFWTGDTDMRCVAEAVTQTRREAYAHHIQRLMVTGCLALLIGARPEEVNRWYLSVYADAVEWAQLPNTHGMALHADGGYLGSKPYAASGKYIDRMSDYCGGCRYSVKETESASACPFNALYWRFLDRHEARFRSNPRMAMIYRTWDRFEAERRRAILQRAETVLETLN